MPEQRVPGLHHVTAVASVAQRNVDFYTDVLGLRLVKRTVNFDDPTTHHLYYGDESGTPGSLLTFFPFGTGYRGHVGRGQPTATSFRILEDSVQYWIDRLKDHDVERNELEERFGQTVIGFEDVDGQPLELVTGTANTDPWMGGAVAQERAIRGIHGVTLSSADLEATERVLNVLGYERRGREGDRIRYETAGATANIIDLLEQPDMGPGQPGAGTVHHIAFRTADEETQAAWADRLSEMNLPLQVSQVKDRQYFKSIYFREPGGILFEIATAGPGLDRDESVESLGSDLKLPPRLEEQRDGFETALPELTDNESPNG